MKVLHYTITDSEHRLIGSWSVNAHQDEQTLLDHFAQSLTAYGVISGSQQWSVLTTPLLVLPEWVKENTGFNLELTEVHVTMPENTSESL